MDKSKYADLFEKLSGYRPRKKGESYEKLVTAVLRFLNPKSSIKHNQFLKGQYSADRYQIDSLINGAENIMVEAKDFSVRNERVGRGEVTKTAGALIDLPLEGGIVVSTTEFTSAAKTFSNGSKINPSAKPIELIQMSIPTESDLRGRILRGRIDLTICSPDIGNTKFYPVLSENGKKTFRMLYGEQTSAPFVLTGFYDVEGSLIETLGDFAEKIMANGKNADPLEGEVLFETSTNLFHDDHLFELKSIKYSIAFKTEKRAIAVEPNGEFALVVKSENGEHQRLITDTDLKRIILAKG